jgi:hypothetical protein
MLIGRIEYITLEVARIAITEGPKMLNLVPN